MGLSETSTATATAPDVLRIAFPPITVPLLGAGVAAPNPTPWSASGGWGSADDPIWCRFVDPAPELAGNRPGGVDTPLTVELVAPPRARWLLAWRGPKAAGPDDFVLALQGVALAHPLLAPGPSLLTPHYLADRWRAAGVVPYPHQLEAARRCLFEMGGRAILADEVGLGKTIEAGIVLTELMLRRLVRRVLILVPAGLMWQWYSELKEKFDLVFDLQAGPFDWARARWLIASLDTAKRPPHRDEVLAQRYDLVMVDEAHHLKNERTRAWQLVSRLSSRYLLLITATPVHNSLRELHALLRLVAPDAAGSYPAFTRRYGAGRLRADDPAGIRELVRTWVIRQRRRETPILLTERRVHTLYLTMPAAERELYIRLDDLSPFLEGEPALLRLTLKRAFCSSPAACAGTLSRLAVRGAGREATDLAQQMRAALLGVKAGAIARLVRRLGPRHVLIFTESTRTQQALGRYLAGRVQRPVVLFHGGLTAMQREWAQNTFRTQAPIMVSTDAGAEGLNLQFCQHVINADLPWNPMRIEQRIGRVHRLGQQGTVHIWNISLRDTVESYVLYLLHEKLQLFRTVIGEIEALLARAGGPEGFASLLATALSGQQEPAALRAALDDLARRLTAHREGLG